MAITEVYVDPSIAADSGTGTIGDPYGDLEYACESETLGTDGTRFNIKAGTDEVLAVELATAVSVGPGFGLAGRPIVFQGYTSTAGDGGIGGISGGGSVSIWGNATADYIHFVDLHLHNTGSNPVISMDNNCVVAGCELENFGGTTGLSFDLYARLIGNYIHSFDCSGDDILIGSDSLAMYNYIDATGSSAGECLVVNGGHAQNNIVIVDGATDAIRPATNGTVINNSIYSNAGTGTGINITAATQNYIVINNLVEGFSGVGGVGIDVGGGEIIDVFGGNAVYNCTTEYVSPQAGGKDYGDNETLSASPFTDAANGDFSPVDTGNVFEGSLPQIIGGGLVP